MIATGRRCKPSSTSGTREMLLAIEVTSTITLGAIIISAALGIASIAVFGYGVRWKAAAQISEATATVYAEGREAYKERSERLEVELRESSEALRACTQALGESKETIARLEALPNLQRILETMGEQSVHQDAAADVRVEEALGRLETFMDQTLTGHEKRAQDRHDAQMELLATMVEKLNGRT